MRAQLRHFFGSLFGVAKEERLKLLLLSIIYFLVIWVYTLVKDLKDSIFISVVGKGYVPSAKLITMFILIPAILFYSYLVNKLRRYQLLYFYALLYGIVGLIFTYYIAHPTIGLQNTEANPNRIFGWLFYFFIEGYSPFVVSVLWAFINSVNSPEAAKNNYGLLVAASKVGGVVSAGLAWYLFSWKAVHGTRFFSDAVNHQLLLFSCSVMLLIIPFIIYLLIKKVPAKSLHGYEAVYQFEREQGKELKQESGILSGLKMLLQWPYMLGIFAMVCFYEVVNTILNYMRLGVAQSISTDISDISGELFRQTFFMQFLGFFISLLGTKTLLEVLGERICLMLIPISTGILLLYFMTSYSPDALVVVFAIFRSINYAFAQPVRESLYIPTIKEMKFKSKSWIDAFGSKVSKGFGSGFNALAETAGSALFFPIHAIFFVVLIIVWSIAAFLLGKRFERAVANNEVIGATSEK